MFAAWAPEALSSGGSVISFAIAAWLAAAPSGPATRVGVAWHEEATADVADQQRVAAEVAAVFGVPPDRLVLGAITLARRLEAYRMDPAAAREISDLQARVELAVAQFRAGDLPAATAQADVVLARLRQQPGLPMASSMAWQLHVLRGRVAWTSADDEATEEAWRAAIAVDPQAQLSGREVPPDVVASYETVRAEVLADRSRWVVPAFDGADVGRAQIEIDGIGGLRPVPPGEHFVVVHWPGAGASAAVFDGAPIVLEAPEASTPADLPRTRAAAERICERLGLDVLVMVRQRGRRFGVQSYACGDDFGEPWYSEGAALDGLADADWDVGGYDAERGVLLDPAPWPEPAPPVVADIGEPLVPIEPPGGNDVRPTKPWFRRAWIWVVAGTVVAGAVTTGVVLGTRDPASSVVVTDEFLRP